VQRIRYERIQFRTRSHVADNPFPRCVIRLMVEEAGEIHHRSRLVFGQRADKLDQFFGCRSHGETLTPRARNGKCHILSILSALVLILVLVLVHPFMIFFGLISFDLL
jgi:hypothetical protein